MLPDEIAKLKDRLSAHLKDNDKALLKKVRSDRYYMVESDTIVRLLKLDRKVKLRFPLAFMDFETTGLSSMAKPIQLGVVVVDRDLTKKEFLKFIIKSIGLLDVLRPEFRQAQTIHKLEIKTIMRGLRPIDVTRHLDLLPGKYPGLLVAGQNAGFDFRQLKKLYELAGQPCLFDYHLVDLTGLAAVHLGVKSLGEIAKALDLDTSRYTKHDALSDAHLTADCFIELMRRL